MSRQSFETVLVGPSGLLREGLIRILVAAKFRVVYSEACVQDLLQKQLPQQQSILLIIDIDATNAEAGFAQIAEFKAIYPDSHVVALADHDRSNDVVSAFRAGADAYLTKVAPCDTFTKALELVMLGQTVLPAETLAFIQDIDDGIKYDVRQELADVTVKIKNDECELSTLSSREKGILRFLVEGDSNKTIARRVNIAEATVKVHVKTILRKIRVRNRTQAAVWAMNKGVLSAAFGNGPSGDEKITTQPAHHPEELLEAQSGHHFFENISPLLVTEL
jgi:DNA-binding NarL/FixJ family response regulator